MIRRGARGTAIAPEVPPDLDPWISWTTVYTGRPHHEHGVKILEQAPETVKGPKIWDIVADAGLPIGVFASIMSWPPRTDIQGFMVPGPFSPGPETFPPELRPIQDLNMTYTRAHTPVAGRDLKKPGKLSLFLGLRRCGLHLATVARAVRFLARKALGRAKEWEAVSLQPVINYDFFARLWRKYRPSLATFHSNHVAHYQHRFWRSTDPAPFLEKPSAAEVERFGGAIEHGYRVADELLARMARLVDRETVLVVASGLGQQPYVMEQFRDGRSIVRIQDVSRMLELIGVAGRCRPFSVMAPQWNLKFDDPDIQRRAVQGLEAAYYKDPSIRLFACTEVGNTVCVNIWQKLPRPIDWEADCVFPTTGTRVKMRDFGAEKDSSPKQGYHHPAGVLMLAGPGVRAGVELGECSTLDIAPTLLTLLGLPVPDYMLGRVLDEALESPARFSGIETPTRLAAKVTA
jgi:Type I phosphodiesterase / nucleotide pyrophosphatase